MPQRLGSIDAVNAASQAALHGCPSKARPVLGFSPGVRWCPLVSAGVRFPAPFWFLRARTLAHVVNPLQSGHQDTRHELQGEAAGAELFGQTGNPLARPGHPIPRPGGPETDGIARLAVSTRSQSSISRIHRVARIEG